MCDSVTVRSDHGTRDFPVRAVPVTGAAGHGAALTLPGSGGRARNSNVWVGHCDTVGGASAGAAAREHNTRMK
eukprot:765387-Hanusia_phi.AAC.2